MRIKGKTRWKTLLWWLLLVGPNGSASAQELFNLTMPASTIPKNSLVIRGAGEWYQEAGGSRGMGVLGLSYGITGNWMMRVMVSASNHHDRYLPQNLVQHRHVGNNTLFYSYNQAQNENYPVLFSGVNIYTQWRFFTRDKYKQHFRLALYGEYSTAQTAHDEAEADLLDDNAGVGAGLIATYLKNRVAVSLTSGLIRPFAYEEVNPDGVHTRLDYKHTYQFNLSFGYLLFPRKYKSYFQSNTNVYLEFIGRYIGGLESIVQDGEGIPLENPAHQSSYYVEVHPGIQQVLNSQTRLELSIGLPLVRKSFDHFTPIIRVGVRHYIFL
ncbi:MAG: hypothetical protein AAFU64_08540 [Bacteroidota bacterium]